MRFRVVVLAGAMTALLASAAPAHAACADESLPASSGEIERVRAAVLCVINEERTARTIRPYRRDARLDAAAQMHAEDMVRRGYYEHNSPGGADDPTHVAGSDVCDRAQKHGYSDCNGMAENLSNNGGSALDRVRGWMTFDGAHCDTVLQGAYNEIGIGVAGPYFVIDTGGAHFPYTNATCPDELVRNGGGKIVLNISSVKRPEISRDSVLVRVTCGYPGKPCRMTATLRTKGRREERKTKTLQPGQTWKVRLHLGKRSRRTLRRVGVVKAWYVLHVAGWKDDYEEDVQFPGRAR